MDDMDENEKVLETLIQTVKIYSKEIGKEFGINKCGTLIMRSGKRYMIKGIELSNQEKNSRLGKKETYQYFGILEVDTIKRVDMEKNVKDYLR